jgi:hypothetical protein
LSKPKIIIEKTIKPIEVEIINLLLIESFCNAAGINKIIIKISKLITAEVKALIKSLN